MLPVPHLCPLHLGGIQPFYIIQNALPTDKQCSATKSHRAPKHIYYFCPMVSARASPAHLHASLPLFASNKLDHRILYALYCIIIFSMLFCPKYYCCLHVHRVSVQCAIRFWFAFYSFFPFEFSTIATFVYGLIKYIPGVQIIKLITIFSVLFAILHKYIYVCFDCESGSQYLGSCLYSYKIPRKYV